MLTANQRTRVKVCGITRPDDALSAVALGADAIGLVFYARSPRAVDAATAARIVGALPPFVTSVGLFVDAAMDEVRAVLERVPLGLLQFHGDESPAYCAGFGRPYMKAVRVRPDTDLRALAADYDAAAGLLLDAYRAGVPGGTGECFDWGLIPAALAKPVILAGGLTPENIADAVRRVRPYAVDVSSGVEADKGIKDVAKMAAFMRGVESADSE